MIAASISSHAISRWQERVSAVSVDEARHEMEAFLSTASVEGKPRNWMREDQQSRASVNRTAPIEYAYNITQPGVCLLIAMTDSPFVLTVVTRAIARDRQREERKAIAVARSGRFARLRRQRKRYDQAS